MRRLRAAWAVVCILATGVPGKGGDTGPSCPPGGTDLRWEGFGVQFVAEHCNRCHDYDTYGQVHELRSEILDLVLSGNMPPLTRLPAEEKDRLAEWISCGLPREASGAPFRRGDANADGDFDISDGIAILLHLFGGAPAPCLDALDADGNLAIDVSDAVAILGYLFLQGSPLPEPFPECGAAGAGLGCAAHGACPGE